MKIDGGCHCGHITYEAEIDPEKVMICNCADCQTLSGSAFRTVAFTREGSFKLLSGNLKTYVRIGESGNKRPRRAGNGARDPTATSTVHCNSRDAGAILPAKGVLDRPDGGYVSDTRGVGIQNRRAVHFQNRNIAASTSAR